MYFVVVIATAELMITTKILKNDSITLNIPNPSAPIVKAKNLFLIKPVIKTIISALPKVKELFRIFLIDKYYCIAEEPKINTELGLFSF